MTNGNRSTEWLDLMLGELEQRRGDAEEARREALRREEKRPEAEGAEADETPAKSTQSK